MKAISLWNPWALLVVTGQKKFETRGWGTSFRGQLAVHAAKKWGPELAALCLTPPFRAALEAAGVEFVATEAACRKGWNLPFGALLGTVFATGCAGTVPTAGLLRDADPAAAEREIAFGDFRPGRSAWRLQYPLRFPAPVPYRGAQGLFDVPDAVIRAALHPQPTR